MITTPGPDEAQHPGGSSPADALLTTAPAGSVAAAVSGIMAAWIAAGSIGLVADPLREVLSWLALAVAIVLAWPGGRQAVLLAVAAATMIALSVVLPTQPAHGVLGVAVVLALLARAQNGLSRRPVLLAAIAATVLGVFQVACTSIATAWMLTGASGLALGRLAEVISGRPLWIGQSFGGVDFLVVMVVLYVGWLRWTRPPRVGRAIYAAAAIAAGHLAYLVLLSMGTELLEALPEPPPPPPLDPFEYRPPDWSWVAAAHTLLHWNLPALAAIIHAVIAALMFRWANWQSVREDDGGRPRQLPVSWVWAGRLAPALLAFCTATLVTLSLGTSDLSGKRIVVYQEGYLHWIKPEHDELGRKSAAGYGVLSMLASSLGGKLRLSADLSESDLADADIVVLLDPVAQWPSERRLRLWEFVRAGGSLLVVADLVVKEMDTRNTLNDLLMPTGMAVRYDVAISEAQHWRYARHTLAHPATLGVDDGRNRFGLGMGSSICVHWPARPILIGRWGWSDPGSDAAMTRVYRYDTGEKLGDLVLAAERRLGKGTVVVLSPTACLTNEDNVTTYPFTGRLLGYLAGRSSNPQSWWRQTLGLLGCFVLVVLLWRRADPLQLVAVSAVLAVSLAASTAVSHHVARVVPGHSASPATRLAYIDASHMEAYSDEPWGPDGIAGLTMTLMRNGYLPLALSELTAERLDRATILISIAPARPFSPPERELVRRFVERGGLFICTVGAEHARPNQELFEELGFHVPPSPVAPTEKQSEPAPLGEFPEQFGRLPTEYLSAADYGKGDYKVRVWTFARWPIASNLADPRNAVVLIRGHHNLPVAVAHHIGSGEAVLIGDTGFAMNKNFGYFDGEPDGEPDGETQENADFWRWLLTRLTDQEDWFPPDRSEESESADDTAAGSQEVNPIENSSDDEVGP